MEVEKIAFHSLTFVLTANSRPGAALRWGKGPWGAVPRSRPWPGPRARGDLSRGHGAAGRGELSPSVHRGRPPTPGPLTPATSPACRQGGEAASGEAQPSAPQALLQDLRPSPSRWLLRSRLRPAETTCGTQVPQEPALEERRPHVLA